jgi:hypothetical protein
LLSFRELSSAVAVEHIADGAVAPQPERRMLLKRNMPAH